MVNLIEGDADELIERIKAEGANSPADVLITVDAVRLWRAEEAGILQPVEFEADAGDPGSHTGWSVIVHGVAEEIWRPEDLAAVRELPLRPWAPGNRDHYVRIL